MNLGVTAVRAVSKNNLTKTKLSLFMVAVLLASSTVLMAESDSDDDLNFKADFIAGLVNDAQWRGNTGPHDTEVVKIFIVGDTPLTAKLKDIVASRKLKVDIRVVALTDDLSTCHILYTPTQDLADLAQILKKVGEKSIITVSNASDFARFGVMINFTRDDGSSKLRYEVNTLVMDMAGISMSEKLMKHAVKI